MQSLQRLLPLRAEKGAGVARPLILLALLSILAVALGTAWRAEAVTAQAPSLLTAYTSILARPIWA